MLSGFELYPRRVPLLMGESRCFGELIFALCGLRKPLLESNPIRITDNKLQEIINQYAWNRPTS